MLFLYIKLQSSHNYAYILIKNNNDNTNFFCVSKTLRKKIMPARKIYTPALSLFFCKLTSTNYLSHIVFAKFSPPRAQLLAKTSLLYELEARWKEALQAKRSKQEPRK